MPAAWAALGAAAAGGRGCGSGCRHALPPSFDIAASRLTQFPLAGLALLDLDLAVGQRFRADDQLSGKADEVHGRELGAGALVASS